MSYPRNSFDPQSQSWAREVQKRIDRLERGSGDLGTRQSNSAKGVSGTLGRLAEQVAALESVVAQQPIILRTAFIPFTSFALTNNSYVTRATASMFVPPGAQFLLLLGDVSLSGSSAGAPATTQIINHQMTITQPLSGGGVNELIMNRFPSLIMPSNAGAPLYSQSGGPVSFITTGLVDNSELVFNYQTQANFSGYTGTGEVSANIYGLFFYRPIGS